MSDLGTVLRQLREIAAAIASGGIGAALFAWLGFPAPFLTGPAVAATLATLAGAQLSIPVPLRNACFVTLGIGIGTSVTPEVLQMAAKWPLSLAMLVVTLVVITLLCQALLSRHFGFDRRSALLAATPGHMSYVLGLSAELDVDPSRIAIVQSLRVLFLTLLVPVLLTLWGVHGTAPLQVAATMTLPTMAALLVVATLLAEIFKRTGIPAAWLLGGMVGSAVGHATSLSTGTLPDWLRLGGFILLGTLIGTRFRGRGLAALRRNLAAGVITTLAACAVAAVGSLVVAEVLDVSPALLLISFAPGGVETMAAMAVQTGLDPTFVAAHHVFRLLVLALLIPVLLARARRSA